MFTAHDAGHMGITHIFAVDSAIGIFIADFCCGLSIGWWKRSHNVHHLVTNHPVSILHRPRARRAPLNTGNIGTRPRYSKRSSLRNISEFFQLSQIILLRFYLPLGCCSGFPRQVPAPELLPHHVCRSLQPLHSFMDTSRIHQSPPTRTCALDSSCGGGGHALLLVLVWLSRRSFFHPNMATPHHVRTCLPHCYHASSRPNHLIPLGDVYIGSRSNGVFPAETVENNDGR